MTEVNTYANNQGIAYEFGRTAIPEEDSPKANVFMKNSSAQFGDNVDVKTEVILIPNQKLYILPKAASQLVDQKESQNAGIASPPILQRGLPTRFLSKRVGLYSSIVLILILIYILTVFRQEGDINPGDFVSREGWGANPSTCTIDQLKIVPKLAVIQHTASDPCTNYEDCIKKVKYMQSYHTNIKGYCDIGYNFMVGGDGRIYEGRGYTARGAHSGDYNSVTIGLAFIGDFVTEHPPEQQLQSAQEFLENTARLGYLSNIFKVCGRNQLSPSDSPGKKLSEDIERWPRYTTDPKDWLKPSQK